MLKRIKVRGKLLMLLATPLVAVMVFAYSGIIDRQDRTGFQEREARIAELADAGADLSLAVQIERIRLLEIEKLSVLGSDPMGAERGETDAQLARWRVAYDAARGDLTDPALRAEFDDLSVRLTENITPDRPANTVTLTILAGVGRTIEETTLSLVTEATDLDLFQALSNLNSLINIQSSYATITSVGSEAIFVGEVRAVAATLITEAELKAERNIAEFWTSADASYLETYQRNQNADILPTPNSGQVDALAEIEEFIGMDQAGSTLDWLLRGEAQLRALNEIMGNLASDATFAAQAEATVANEEAQSFLVLAGSVVLLALVMAVFVGRSISRPLIRLTRNAEQLSTEELPALVESLRSAGRAEAPVLTPIEAKGRDEVAQLAHAISEIQQVTMDVAEEQSELLRRGISDIFVNLARRNQSLLDRQIDFIDQLESREENPDQLENLFRLDHLATRMRRNAESLLVLAGAEPTRRRGRPVEIVDVLRVAMGEIEDFSRISLMSVDASTVAGSVAVDLAHLMSEIMENATQFSPPEVDVDVVGYRIADGSYQLTLADKGIGMSAEQIATANKTLAEPPLVGLDLSRSLGFTVVSRLAHRLGVSVQLASGAEGGVTAVVTIPAEMVGEAGAEMAPDTGVAETPPAPAAPVVEASQEPTVDLMSPPDLAENPFGESTPRFVEDPPKAEPAADAAPTPALAEEPPATMPTAEAPPTQNDELAALPTRRPTTPPAPAPEPVAEAPTEPTPAAAADDTDLFAAFGAPTNVPPVPPTDPEQDLFAPIDGGSALPTRQPTAAPADTPPAPEMPTQQLPVTPTPQPQPEPVAAPQAAAPLPTRDPAAVGAVDQQVTSAGLIRRTPKQVDVPEESKYAPGATPATAGPPAAEAIAPASNRSPEEVRQMLSRYRSGLRKGRTPDSGTDQSNGRS
ncbi:MAG: ATP-binding protein [Actinomycetota bacterium]